MRLDLINCETIVWISLQQASKQVCSISTEAGQDIHVLLRDTSQDLVSALVALHRLLLERIDSTDHFISEHAQTPPVDSEAVTRGLDHFWCQIFGCSAESVSHTILCLLHLAEAEICQFEMALRVEENILWLQVTIDDSVLVEVSESQHDLGCIEARSVLSESNLVAEMEEKLAAIQKVGDEIQTFVGLKGVVELDNERMCDLLHDVPLNLDLVRLVGADDEVLLERLHRVDLIACLLLGEVDFTKGASANDLEQLEVFDGQLGFLLGVAQSEAALVEAHRALD